MAKDDYRRERLEKKAKGFGFHVAVWSPHDGSGTRYSFIRSRKPVSYFSRPGVFIARGLAEAEAWLTGYEKAKGR